MVLVRVGWPVHQYIGVKKLGWVQKFKVSDQENKAKIKLKKK
jgi:hypothetical protein